MNEALLKRMYARRTFGIKPGLETTRALLAELGNPERGLAVVHVAGTNGKGSVSAMIAAVLSASGLRTGLYTSPHLRALTERFRIDGREVAPRELDDWLAAVEAAAERVERAQAGVPTFFECMTAVAVLGFVQRGVAIAVMETGMGGRLDATNVLHPLVSVITRIGMDHMAHLGDTLEAIAGEKAGIVKPGVPVVCGLMPDRALAVVQARAREIGAPLIRADERVTVTRVAGDLQGQRLRLSSHSMHYGVVNIKLAAVYQVENVATALTAVETLADVLRVVFDRKTVVKGLSETEWIGRFQCIGEHPRVIVDGAHNPDGAAALVEALKAADCGRSVRFVVGQCDDKDVDGFFKAIAGVCARVWVVPFDNPRAMAPERLAAVAARHGLEAVACATPMEGLTLAKADAMETDAPVVVCGSLFLVGAWTLNL